MFDPSSLLGGMLSGGFGRRRARSSGPGVLGTVATVGGIAAVGGLGYMAYKHFTAQPGAQAPGAPGWGGSPQGAPAWGASEPGAPPGVGGWGSPAGAAAGPPPGVGGWGPPPGGAPAGGGPAGPIGDFVKGLVGNTGGLQTGGFGAGVPGYEYQSGAGAPGGAAPAGGAPWGAPAGGSPPAAGAAWPAPPGGAAPGWTPPGGAAVAGAAPGWAPPGGAVAPGTAPAADVPAGAIPIPPPPVFDASGRVVTAPAPPAAAASAPPTGPGSVAAPTDAEQRAAMLLVRAMVAAANADGTIDAEERQEILGRLEATGLGAEERAALAAELDRPRPVAALAVEVTDPELAKQFYAVSLLAIDVDNAAERMHLQTLPAMLKLSADEVAKIHAELGVPAIV